MTFQRARKKEQIKNRREEILRAAEELFNEGGLEDVTFSRIAKQVSFTRQTIYTYYQTREEVLLDLLGLRLEQFYTSLHTMFPAGQRFTRQAFCRIVAREFLSHKNTLRLFSLRHTVLEQNVRYENLVAFNRIMLKVFPTVEELLREQCPATSKRTFDVFTFTLIPYFASIYPMLNPHPDQLKAVFAALGTKQKKQPTAEDCLVASLELMTSALKFAADEKTNS